MGHPSRKRKMASRVDERRFPFVVQIAAPEDGFGLMLDAINAWHRYTKVRQHRARPQRGKQRFGRWCFVSLEIAEKFKARFGGEIITASGAQKREFGRKAAVDDAFYGDPRSQNGA
jgi:hypothetical protein